MAKLLASEASWAAANTCLDTHGGNGFVDSYDVERKFREAGSTRSPRLATTSSRAFRDEGPRAAPLVLKPRE